jgi:3-oxoacyl-[acyl-carrier-protein] synthase II
MPRVFVSGIGVLSALGSSHEAFRDALLGGRSAIGPVTGFAVDECRSVLAAEIVGFEPGAWVAPMKLRRLDRTGVYALAAAKLAVADAQLALAPSGHDDVGVVLGTWSAGGQSTQVYLDALFRQGPIGAPAILFDSTVGNSAASLVGLEYKLRGPNLTISHKEASGLAAMVTAVDHLREGRARALFAGGVDAVFETFFKGHDRFGVMSREAHWSPACAPFDSTRAGFVLGEGGFGLWLSREPPAEGAPCYGEILGASASSTAVALNQWPDAAAPLTRTMRLALDDAQVDAREVHVVYASANAFPALDRVEAVALSEVFGDANPVVTSIKGALGEFGAAGTAACAAALLCGGVGRVPPVAGLSRPAEQAQGLHLALEAEPAPGPIVLVNGFASGGALFSLVLRVGTPRTLV